MRVLSAHRPGEKCLQFRSTNTLLLRRSCFLWPLSQATRLQAAVLRPDSLLKLPLCSK